MGILKTILLIAIVYYALKLIRPLISGNKEANGSGQGNRQGYKFRRKGNGEVKVKYNPEKGRTASDSGDYIDYEEVKD